MRFYGGKGGSKKQQKVISAIRSAVESLKRGRSSIYRQEQFYRHLKALFAQAVCSAPPSSSSLTKKEEDFFWRTKQAISNAERKCFFHRGSTSDVWEMCFLATKIASLPIHLPGFPLATPSSQRDGPSALGPLKISADSISHAEWIAYSLPYQPRRQRQPTCSNFECRPYELRTKEKTLSGERDR